MPFVPLEVYANQAQTTVPAGAGAVAQGTVETWTVTASASFPAVELGAQQFHVADPAAAGEIVTVQNISGTTWRVQRGAEGTTPVVHAAGFTVVQVITAGVMAASQFPPWQFPVQSYGAQGDGKIGTGGTGTSGTSAFSDSGASFVNAAAPLGDVGKFIIINQGAGSAMVPTAPFVGTISAVTSATSVTLSGNLAANCSAAPYVYGTDDAGPITAAVNAAAAWARSTGNFKAQVVFEPCLYMLGTLTQTTSPYHYNTHIPVPFSGQYERKLVLDFVCIGGGSSEDFWGSAVPSAEGTCLVSASWTASQPNGTYGQQSVIGTPSDSTNIGDGGSAGGTFANVLVNVDGLTVLTPWNSAQYSYDFRWAAQVSIPDASAKVFAPVNFSGQAVGGTWIRQTSIPPNGVAVGLAMPLSGNNDLCQVGSFAAEGIAIGTLVSEHFCADRLVHIYCDTGIKVTFVPQGTTIHGGTIQYWSCEGCNTGILTTDDATHVFPLWIGSADFQVIASYYVHDTNGILTGTMYWYDIGAWSPQGAGLLSPGRYNIVNTRMVPGKWVANAALSIPAAPAAPGNGTAQQNTAFLKATVYASASTSITAFAVGPASGSLQSVSVTAGAGVVVPVRVPAGWWYSVTYTGTLTTTWFLDPPP